MELWRYGLMELESCGVGELTSCGVVSLGAWGLEGSERTYLWGLGDLGENIVHCIMYIYIYIPGCVYIYI